MYVFISSVWINKTWDQYAKSHGTAACVCGGSHQIIAQYGSSSPGRSFVNDCIIPRRSCLTDVGRAKQVGPGPSNLICMGRGLGPAGRPWPVSPFYILQRFVDINEYIIKVAFHSLIYHHHHEPYPFYLGSCTFLT